MCLFAYESVTSDPWCLEFTKALIAAMSSLCIRKRRAHTVEPFAVGSRLHAYHLETPEVRGHALSHVCSTQMLMCTTVQLEGRGFESVLRSHITMLQLSLIPLRDVSIGVLAATSVPLSPRS